MTLAEARQRCERMNGCMHTERIARIQEVWAWFLEETDKETTVTDETNEARVYVLGELTYYLGAMAGDLMGWMMAFKLNKIEFAPWAPDAKEAN